VPETLSALVLELLAKRREDRIGSAQELEERLGRLG
jgi:hypothetical protein